MTVSCLVVIEGTGNQMKQMSPFILVSGLLGDRGNKILAALEISHILHFEYRF